MIIQFPTPYPDELLYSVISRYHVRAGNVFWKHTLEDLFGKRTISASVFLPSGIGSLVQHLPKNTTLNEQIFIEKHTMYPFYTVFLPTEKAQSIYESMTSEYE
ncbi:TniQ family protein [Niallia sp. Sow4_A1]|uniref:TniQ family protein n=1 Tax=Niallia hominis TaxID=3133173 RepID=A0ABV1F012_9BACI